MKKNNIYVKASSMANRPISDMEINGVYFEPIPQQEETICHYSGLPSLSSYIETTPNEWAKLS